MLENFSKRTILIAVIGILLAGNVFLGVGYFLQNQEAQKMQTELASQKLNTGVIRFLDLFIVKVLKSNTEVSFEDRLKLENAVRDLKDKDILAKWEGFTGATTQDQVQQGVKDLMQLLVEKISY